VSYWLHPEAAQEHKKQVAHYEEIQAGLGARYHAEFLSTLERVCASPDRFRIVLSPDIRRAIFKVFHFDVIYREVDGVVQVLAIAHHRRQPAYWAGRL
jgi:plasmid stabilization system protein ParE